MATHGARAKVEPPQLPEYFFDTFLCDRSRAFEAVREVLDEIIEAGAAILHSKFLDSQVIPYASRTLARELVTNATWSILPIDTTDVFADPDDDLAMPAIDEWASGVLPMRDAEATGLRTAVNPEPEPRRPHPPAARPTRHSPAQPVEVHPPTTAPARGPRSARPSMHEAPMPRARARPPPTEGETILRTFDEIRKKSTVSTKAVTVDADFNVIQIQEPKGLPPSLIIPRIAAKKVVKQDKTTSLSGRAPRPPIKKPEAPKRKVQPKLIETDAPRFDTAIAEVTFADKIVCAPGVTFRDGNAVKTRPPVTNANQLTRAQYEEYLQEMKRLAEAD
jgi:hypothetical protein